MRLWVYLLCSLLLVPSAYAVTCSAVFPNAASSYDEKIKLEGSVSLINTSGGVLTTPRLETSGRRRNCDSQNCTASGSAASEPTIPANSSRSNMSRSVSVWGTGQYYYYDAEIKQNRRITLSGNGKVIVHVKNDLKIEGSARINEGGDASRLIFIVQDDVEIKGSARVNAYIYAKEDIKIEGSARVTGAVNGEKVEIKGSARVTYESADSLAVDGVCTAGGSSGSTSYTNSCSTIFANAVGTLEGPITLRNSARLSNTGDRVLETNRVTVDGDSRSGSGSGSGRRGNRGASTNNYCDNGACTASGHNLAAVSIPSNSSRTDLTRSITLYPGDYYYDDIDFRGGDVLNLSGSGQVRIHVGDDFNARSNARINANGDPSRLIFLVGDDVYIRDSARVNAYIYAKEESKVRNSGRLEGALVAQNAEIKDSGRITYVEPSNLEVPGFCGTESDAGTAVVPEAEFHLDDTGLDGTAGEIEDAQSNYLAARLLGTSNGADSDSNGKLCSAIDIPRNTSKSQQWAINTGIDIDDDIGNQGSISFWYKSNTSWVTSADRVLFDASKGNKYFILTLKRNGSLYFGFEDVRDRDYQLTASAVSIAADTWKYITVTWDVTAVTASIYIDGVKQTASVRNNGVNRGIGELDTLYVGDNRTNYVNNGYSANGVIDELKIYKSVISTSQMATDMAETRECENSASVPPDGFNCVESGQNPASGRLYTKLVGNSFSFDVVALSSGGTHSGYASDLDKTVTVELVDASGGAACASRPALSPAVYDTLAFTASDAGAKSSGAFTVNKAYPSVSCRVTDSTGDNIIQSCSTDVFAIRPASLSLNTPSLNNSGYGSGDKQTAGSSFSLAVSGGSGYTGSPTVDTVMIEAHNNAVATGTLTGAFGSANSSGIASGSSFTYSEVGNFRFLDQAIYDTSFTSVDQSAGDCTNDFSNTLVGGKYGCKFANSGETDWVGRFTPADFVLSAADDGVLENTCDAGSFSYQGESIAYTTDPVLQLTAVNANGDTTQNYTGNYAKLTTSEIVFSDVTQDSAANGTNGQPITITETKGTKSLTDNGDGTHELTLSNYSYIWGRASTHEVAPFDTGLELGISSASDSDSISASDTSLTLTPSATEMRYGRLAMTAGSGSDIQDLNIPMTVEYYASGGSGFITNTDDSCTSVTSFSWADSDTSDALTSSDTCFWDNDDDSGQGCVDTGSNDDEYNATPTAGAYNINLKAPGEGNSGALELSAIAPSALQYDWNGSGNEDPSASVVFGVSNRETGIIFRREVR